MRKFPSPLARSRIRAHPAAKTAPALATIPSADGPSNVLHVQRLVGNRTVSRLLQRLDDNSRLLSGADGPSNGRASDARVVSDIEQRIDALRGRGSPLPPVVRTPFESRFRQDFSGVRVHEGADADALASRLGARAFTTGNDVVFAAGEFAPESQSGRRLLAHELTHVVQQGNGAALQLQRSRLRDFKDTEPTHDPSKLTDAEMERTDEFKSYMNSSLVWQWQHKMTREESLLASRLMLRQMRSGEAVIWTRDAARFMTIARRQLGTLRESEKLVGKLAHERASWTQFEDPFTAESDFIRWVLAGEPIPADAAKMNCWEMILFGAFKGGFVTKSRLQRMYGAAARWTELRPDLALAPPEEIERQLCTGPLVTINLTDPTAAEPLAGDVIIFDFIARHAAISMGRTAIGGEHLVISLHAGAVEKTTIEALQRRRDLTGSSAKLCRPNWQ